MEKGKGSKRRRVMREWKKREEEGDNGIEEEGLGPMGCSL